MAWKKNRKIVARGFPDLEYLPKGQCDWDCSLASLAYGVRRALLGRSPGLNAWAARHGLPGSARYAELGRHARVLWHGTSRMRAEKIAEHGLFHKRGLWTTLNPAVSHGFCRGRSESFGTEGAVVCLVVDRSQMERDRDFDVEGAGDIFRFHHGLPADVVEYVLVKEEIRFLGRERAHAPAPWRRAAFKKRSGRWVPVQATPVRYSDTQEYASVEEFAGLCLDGLLDEFAELTALEFLSTLYACVEPWDAVSHDQALELFEDRCVRHARRKGWHTFRARDRIEAL